MTVFRTITPHFAVAPQLSPQDMAAVAAAGFRLVINNRPDGEAPGQPSTGEMSTAAEAAGLQFQTLPFQGLPSPATAAATAGLLEEAEGPVLAYCRTGTRSIMAWAMAQALSGAAQPGELIAMAADVGYDLNAVRGALEALAPNAGRP
ncbi:MAG: TIGR01244 family sulfur transferase [Terricaulis sp.]